MAGKSKKKSKKQKACTSSVHKKGHYVVVKAKCHIGKAELVTPQMCKHLPRKTKGKTTKVIKHKTKHIEVPAACKGLKGKERKECAKRVCSLRPAEYKQECLKKAGIR